MLVAAKVATAQKPADCCANEGLCGREPSPAKPMARFARKPVAKLGSMATGLSNSPGCPIVLASLAIVRAAAQLRNSDGQTPGIEPFFGGRNRSDEHTGPGSGGELGEHPDRPAGLEAGDDEPRNAGEAGGVRSAGLDGGGEGQGAHLFPPPCLRRLAVRLVRALTGV